MFLTFVFIRDDALRSSSPIAGQNNSIYRSRGCTVATGATIQAMSNSIVAFLDCTDAGALNFAAARIDTLKGFTAVPCGTTCASARTS